MNFEILRVDYIRLRNAEYRNPGPLILPGPSKRGGETCSSFEGCLLFVSPFLLDVGSPSCFTEETCTISLLQALGNVAKLPRSTWGEQV